MTFAPATQQAGTRGQMHRDSQISVPVRRETETDQARHNHAELRLFFQSEPLAVRRALESILSGLGHLNMSQDDCGTVELVLAEVMNNIVEHAYAGDRSGVIELHISGTDRGLFCTVIDDGLPMPDGNPPMGKEHDLNCTREELPEGGFGWALIRELAQELGYERDGDRNRLTFLLNVDRAILTS